MKNFPQAFLDVELDSLPFLRNVLRFVLILGAVINQLVRWSRCYE